MQVSKFQKSEKCINQNNKLLKPFGHGGVSGSLKGKGGWFFGRPRAVKSSNQRPQPLKYVHFLNCNHINVKTSI